MPTYTEDGSGGVVLAGEALPIQIILVGGSGGVVLAGEALPIQITLVGGGVLCGGAALRTDDVYHYPNDPNYNPLIVIGGTPLMQLMVPLIGEGEVVVGGTARVRYNILVTTTGNSDDAPPDFAGVTVGYQNSLNPTLVSFEFTIALDLSWRVNAYITKDLDLSWNVGRGREYWYRIIGKGRPDQCPPLESQDPCCRKYLLNVHARSVEDLCQKLQDRQWKWPVESVQRFLKPAESEFVNEDLAAGIDYECQKVEVVDICTNLICAEFCLDYDLEVATGITTTVWFVGNFSVTMDGGVFTGGVSEAEFLRFGVDYESEGEGEVIIAGEAITFSTYYSMTMSGEIVIGGVAELVSSAWNYVGGVWPYVTGLKLPTMVDQFQQGVNDSTWLLPNRAKLDDGLATLVDLSFGKFSKFLVVKGFNLNLPTSDFHLLGIQMTLDRRAVVTARDFQFYLTIDNEILSDNLAAFTTNWPTGGFATATYGSNQNTWRNPNNSDYLGEWTAAELNDPDFGVALRVRPSSSVAGAEARIDVVYLNAYHERTEHQTIRIGGNAIVRSSQYRITASGSIIVSGTALQPRRTYRFTEIGRGPLGPEFSSVLIGGDYIISWVYVGSGTVVVGGSATVLASHWSMTATGGVIISGQPRVVSPDWHYTPANGVGFGGSTAIIKIHYQRLVGEGTVTTGGSINTSNSHSYTANGEVVIDGESLIVSSMFSWIGSGTVIIGGAGLSESSDQGVVETILGLVASVTDVVLVFSEESTAEEMEVLGTTVTKCDCVRMPLVIPMVHNLVRNNKLAQFLARNNLSVPRIVSLLYNRPNDSWQANFRYQGYASDSNSKESWNLIFELQCTNLVEGVIISENIWKFTTTILQKSLVTYEDFDTKIIVGFVRTPVCSQGNDFKIRINLDTQAETSDLTPDSVVYQFLLYDNIGLFQTPAWINNPNLDITISQTGFSTPNPRQVLNI